MILRSLAPAVAAALSLGMPGVAAAQSRPEPQLLLTMFGGAVSGATLYESMRQPLALLEDPSAVDTLALSRRISPSITIGASATYFPIAAFGLSGEITFLAFGLDDSCTLTYTASTPARTGYNEQICADIASKGLSASTIAFYVGGLYRFLPRGAVKPYVRAQAGFAVRSGSTVEVSGRFLDGTGTVRDRLVIEDLDPGSLAPSASFGVGVMVPFAPGYQARLEFRDHLLAVDRVSGPANALAQAPTEGMLAHSVGLVITLDIVLEQRRGRRY
jgi:hypothetical protein